MPNLVLSDPLGVHDHDDPGDEVFRRFRFQASYAAMLAIGILEDGNEVAELYCEQFEDILLQLVSGKFRGIQVKTKADGAQAFRATDEPILDSLVRFVELDLSFPGAFEGYCLASNIPFDRVGKGHGNLPSVLAELRAVDQFPGCPRAKGLAKTVVARLKKKVSARRKAAGSKGKGKPDSEAPGNPGAAPLAEACAVLAAVTEADALRVFAKLDIRDDLPKLPDLGSRML
ncbi:MAG TPA: dsDNA nuclease domain-containing protein, partial [Polyangiaceae bacterium]